MQTDDSRLDIRKDAEAIAEQASSPGDSAQEKLIYELKVHQIELEMQNTELRDSQEELQRSRSQYELLFDFAPVPYFVFNEEGGIEEVNHAGAAIIKAERKHLERKPFVVFLSQEFHTPFFDHLRRVFEVGHRQSVEVQLRTRTGGGVWVRLESRPQNGMKGNAQCLTAIIDVSDHKRFEDDLILAREDAVNANRAKSLFLANMSHEIRTPMNGILSISEFALQAGASGELEGYLQTIHNSAASLISILDDVLDLTTIESDRSTLQKEPFRPEDLLHTLEAMFGPNIAEKRLSLRLEIADSLSEVLIGDRDRLRQILVNLLSNAIEYTDAGEITLRVTETEISDFVRELIFEVHDSGRGIDPTEQKRILETFNQSVDNDHQRYEGRGIGLAISRRLATLLGGQLYFETDPGSGTRFFCSVPLEIPADGERLAATSPPRPAQKKSNHHRILVAEDNAVNLLVIRTLLEKAGYDIESVNNGQDALDALERGSFDLILMDISMPGMDGITATRTIRRDVGGKYNTAIPVIAISAHSMKGDRERFLEAGMNDYISKPFTRETVLSVIGRYLGDDQ